jgi:hypothetical protein
LKNNFENQKFSFDNQQILLSGKNGCGKSNILERQGNLFIEDLWISFYAQHKLHWKLQSIDVPLTLVDDGKDQFRGLINKKSDFLKYLVEKQKWNLDKTY